MAGTVYISNYIEFGDGIHDDGPAIQRAIKYCWDYSKDVLEFDEMENGKPKTYIVNTELCVYGNNLTINGHGCNLRKTKISTVAELGALFNIYGLVPGLKYNGAVFNGTSKPATNITVNDLNVVFVPDVTRANTDPEMYTNGFAICHADTVTLNRCTVYGAPQTNFAVVSGTNKVGKVVNVKNVLLNGCSGTNSRKHTFRLNAMAGSAYFSATMKDCKAYNTLEPNVAAYGIEGLKVHLLCNKSDKDSTYVPGPFSYVVENFTHDSTGIIAIRGEDTKYHVQGIS